MFTKRVGREIKRPAVRYLFLGAPAVTPSVRSLPEEVAD